MGTIKALCISEKKGTLKTPVHKALFQTEWGMVGDAHAGRWHRQVSFLGLAEIEAFRKRGIGSRSRRSARNATRAAR